MSKKEVKQLILVEVLIIVLFPIIIIGLLSLLTLPGMIICFIIFMTCVIPNIITHEDKESESYKDLES